MAMRKVKEEWEETQAQIEEEERKMQREMQDEMEARKKKIEEMKNKRRKEMEEKLRGAEKKGKEKVEAIENELSEIQRKERMVKADTDVKLAAVVDDYGGESVIEIPRSAAASSLPVRGIRRLPDVKLTTLRGDTPVCAGDTAPPALPFSSLPSSMPPFTSTMPLFYSTASPPPLVPFPT